MTLVSKLRQKLADERPSAERHDFHVADPEAGSAVNLAIVQRDGLSSLFWEIRIQRPTPPEQTMRQWADRLAARVTSLLEPLAALEVDVTRNQAMLRSPAPTEQGAMYFEVLLDGTEFATLRRYQANTAGQARREQVAFALTHEALLKLVADFTAI